MNIKAYIDYFDEIAANPRDQQFDQLEGAQRAICAKYRVPVFAIVGVLTPVLCLSIGLGAVYWLWDPSLGLLVITAIFMLVFARLIVSEINMRLIHNGLLVVLGAEHQMR